VVQQVPLPDAPALDVFTLEQVDLSRMRGHLRWHRQLAGFKARRLTDRQ
jgi:hypothetical protein